MQIEQRNCKVTLPTYKSIFYNHFNLRFKSVKKDTCKTSDRFTILAESATDEKRKSYLQAEHDNYPRKAKAAEAEMNDNLHRAHVDPKIECLTHDLQKVVVLPRIPTNTVYNKRQLSMFNLGIHCGSKNNGYFWVETEGGQGAQDIGSVQKKHINESIPSEVETLILWSDSCGGQNRNIKICLLIFSTYTPIFDTDFI